MKPLSGLLEKILNGIRVQPREGDYYGEDGLLRCGRCGQPREFRFDNWQVPGFEGREPRFTVRPDLCMCERDEQEARERREAMLAEDRARRANRSRCFDFGGMEACRFERDDRRDAHASDVCHSYVEHFEDAKAEGQGILMTGGFGNGKTFLAGCVANALLDKGYRVRFTSLANLNSRITSNYGNSGPVIDELAACDLVVLDDLGTERKTSTANENAYQIVNALYSRKIPMLFTTNIPAREIGSDDNPDNARIYSRIIERCMPLKVEGDDRRKHTGGTDWKFGR